MFLRAPLLSACFFCGHRFAAGLASYGLRTKVATLVSANPLSLRSFFAAHSVCPH
nr:MAG TPA: hypothetical protein [Inoviridae sp.]